MPTDTRAPRENGNGFLIGFMTGTLVCAGVAIWLAPRSSSLRRRVTDAVKSLDKLGDEVGSTIARGAEKAANDAAVSRRADIAELKKRGSA